MILETLVLLALYMQSRCFFSHFWSEDINTAILTLPSVLQYIVNTSFRIRIVLKVASILSEITSFVLKNKISKIDILSSESVICYFYCHLWSHIF